MSANFPALISVDWLNQNLGRENLVILDASVPPITGEVRPDLKNFRIKGARFFDLNGRFSDKDSDLPHMMPSEEQFEKEAQLLGINEGSRIVIYDNLGVYSSPRAWWMFKSMGHEEVAVLNGGLPVWIDASLPVQTIRDEHISPGNFKAKFDSSYFRNAKTVLHQLRKPGQVVIDARSEGRFKATAPEPRAHLKGGHIPGSKNLPFAHLIHGFKIFDSGELSSRFNDLAEPSQEVVFSCGSGLTACILALGAYEAGFRKLSVYDGSWSEWGKPELHLPIEK